MITDYHPELDDSPLLDAKGVKIYQMLIGCAQWAVTLGRYDIQYATNTLQDMPVVQESTTTRIYSSYLDI